MELRFLFAVFCEGFLKGLLFKGFIRDSFGVVQGLEV